MRPVHGLAVAIRLAFALVFAATAHAQAGEWAWISGGSVSSNQTGVYGTIGVPAAGNVAGDRGASTTWTDSSGNLWLFGRSGTSDGTGSGGHDLWKFDPSTSQWTWVSGSNNTTAGVYGTLGVAATTNVPGSRESAVGWTDSSGSLWLFGGWGYDSTQTFGSLNDLWKFDPVISQWTWMGGSNTLPNASDTCQPGVYGKYCNTVRCQHPWGPLLRRRLDRYCR
jgi:hypothetical protein